MTKREKRLEKLRQNPKNVRPDELDAVLIGEGFVIARQKGSHKRYDRGIHQLTVPQREPFLLDVYVRYSYTKPWSTLKFTLKSGVTTVPCGCTSTSRKPWICWTPSRRGSIKGKERETVSEAAIHAEAQRYMALPYRIEFVPGDGGWFVAIPDLPGCMSQGRTQDEALEMIREAQELWVEGALAKGTPIPEPGATEKYRGVALTADSDKQGAITP